MRDEDKTKAELLQEIAGLRNELAKQRAPRGTPGRRGAGVPDGMSPTEFDVLAELEWDLSDPTLPAFEDVEDIGDPSQFLAMAKALGTGLDREARFGKDVTESGSFDLRWMRLASFAKLLEAIPTPVLLLDLRGVIQYANRSFIGLGNPNSDFLGTFFQSLFRGSQAGGGPAVMLDQVREGRTWGAWEGNLSIDGREVWCRMNVRSIRFGAERSLLVVLEDLTAERKELSLNEKYGKLVGIIPIGIAEFLPETPVSPGGNLQDAIKTIIFARLTDANPEFARLMEVDSIGSLKDKALHEVFPCKGDDLKLIAAWVRNSFAATSREHKERYPQGQDRYFENTLVGIVQDDRLTAFWAIREDVTARKRGEQALLEKIRIIDELYEHVVESGKAKAIAEHTSKVAHELRQPLAIIGGFARRMAKECSTCEGVAEHGSSIGFEIIVREVERLEQVLGRLIDFTTREKVHQDRIDPNAVIDYVIRINQERFKERKIRLETDLGPEIGDILVDAERFEEVVRNLLANAIDASPPGETVRIQTCVSIPGERIHRAGKLESEAYFEMKIENHGKTIPPEELAKIFSPFETTRDYGAGIALTLAKKVIEDHRGSISVKSDDRGTLFTVWLPLTLGGA